MIGGGESVQFTVSLGSVMAILGMIITGLVGWWRGSRGLRKMALQVAYVVQDWNGTPGRPGVPEHPGIMVRMASIESWQAQTTAQLVTNGGSTLRDAVKRVEQSQVVVESRLAELVAQGRQSIAQHTSGGTGFPSTT